MNLLLTYIQLLIQIEIQRLGGQTSASLAKGEAIIAPDALAALKRYGCTKARVLSLSELLALAESFQKSDAASVAEQKAPSAIQKAANFGNGVPGNYRFHKTDDGTYCVRAPTGAFVALLVPTLRHAEVITAALDAHLTPPTSNPGAYLGRSKGVIERIVNQLEALRDMVSGTDTARVETALAAVKAL